MASVPIPDNEAARLEELHQLAILDSLPEQAYDDIALLAAQICETPIALISLVDADRQWFKATVGIDATETPRDLAFCAHAILEPTQLLVVPDATKDERFASNPLVVSDPAIRLYAGAPLTTSKGHGLGTLCVIDREARHLTVQQQRALQALARQVATHFELRSAVQELERRAQEQERYEEQLLDYQRRLEENLALIAEQSITDPLTGLRNRRALLAKLEEEFYRFQRHRAPLALALLDVDHFKPYNDEFGHPAGDMVLCEMAQLLKHDSRESDFVARYGGEEFAMVYVNTAPDSAALLGERLRKSIERANWEFRNVTVSVGIANITDQMQTIDDLIAAADRSLYEAKELGRNRVVTA